MTKFYWVSVGKSSRDNHKNKISETMKDKIDWTLSCVEVNEWAMIYKKDSRRTRMPRAKRKCATCGKY